jgi:hypothetical protein
MAFYATIAWRLRAGSSSASSYSVAVRIIGKSGGAEKHSADKLLLGALGVTNNSVSGVY